MNTLFSRFTGSLAFTVLFFVAATVSAVEPERPSTMVTTHLDVVDPFDGVISLREAINYAQPGDTVTFAPFLQDVTIMLKLGALFIDKDISIIATGQNITVDANQQSRVFNVLENRAVSLNGLTTIGDDMDGNATVVADRVFANTLAAASELVTIAPISTLTADGDWGTVTSTTTREGTFKRNWGDFVGHTAIHKGSFTFTLAHQGDINSCIQLTSPGWGDHFINNDTFLQIGTTRTSGESPRLSLLGYAPGTYTVNWQIHIKYLDSTRPVTITINPPLPPTRLDNWGTITSITTQEGTFKRNWGDFAGHTAVHKGFFTFTLAHQGDRNSYIQLTSPGKGEHFINNDTFLQIGTIRASGESLRLSLNGYAPGTYTVNWQIHIKYMDSERLVAITINPPVTPPPIGVPLSASLDTERLTKEWVTDSHAVTTPRTRVIVRGLDTGFVVDKVFTHWSGFGLYAEGLVTSQEMLDEGYPREAILVFRGTTADPLDIISDLHPLGVGFDQYLLNRERLFDWAKGQSNLHITGHSLGGALAQWFAADWTGNEGGTLKSLETFNAPGISTAWANMFNDRRADSVAHQVIEGDLVSLAGRQFIKDKETVNIYAVGGNLFTRHASSWDVRQRIPSKVTTATDFSNPFYSYPGSMINRSQVEGTRILAGKTPITGIVVGGTLVVVDTIQKTIVSGAKQAWGWVKKISPFSAAIAFNLDLDLSMISDTDDKVGEYLLILEFGGNPGNYMNMLDDRFTPVEALWNESQHAYHVKDVSQAEISRLNFDAIENLNEVSLYDLNEPVAPLGIEAVSITEVGDGSFDLNINSGTARADAVITITLESITGSFLDEPALTTTLGNLQQDGWRPKNDVPRGMYYVYLRVECGNAIPEMVYFEDPITISILSDTTKCNHNYESVVTHLTCTEDGYTTHTCTICGESYETDRVKAPGHDYEAYVVEPTCEEDGYTLYFCTRCGDWHIADEVPALGHDYMPVVTDPTCTEDGYTIYICTRCGDWYISDEVPALGHDYMPVVTDPTCTEDGYWTVTCSVCGGSHDVIDEGSALGCDYVPVVTDPTCTEDDDEYVDRHVVMNPTHTEEDYPTHPSDEYSNDEHSSDEADGTETNNGNQNRPGAVVVTSNVGGMFTPPVNAGTQNTGLGSVPSLTTGQIDRAERVNRPASSAPEKGIERANAMWTAVSQPRPLGQGERFMNNTFQLPNGMDMFQMSEVIFDDQDFVVGQREATRNTAVEQKLGNYAIGEHNDSFWDNAVLPVNNGVAGGERSGENTDQIGIVWASEHVAQAERLIAEVPMVRRQPGIQVSDHRSRQVQSVQSTERMLGKGYIPHANSWQPGSTMPPPQPREERRPGRFPRGGE